MLDLKSSQVDLPMQKVILNLIRMGHEKKEKSYDKSILPFSTSIDKNHIRKYIELELKPGFESLRTLFDAFENELDVAESLASHKKGKPAEKK